MNKLFLIALIAGSLTACKQPQEAAPAAPAAVAPAAPAVVAPTAPVVAPVAPVVAPVAPAAPAEATGPSKPETKKVCVVINGKEKCKTAKVHKKFEGTQVPPKK